MATMRLRHLASEGRRPDQLTVSYSILLSICNMLFGLFFEVSAFMFWQVLVRNVPPDPDESVNEHVEHFFCVNHPDHYLCHQVCFFLPC